jgi:dTDP-4-amino-4,6-dideoxygalactose transaminase
VAHTVAKQILCLPIYADLPLEQIDSIVELIGTA